MKKLFTLLICSSMLLFGCSDFSEMESVDGIREIKFTFGVDNDNSKSRTTMPADGLSSLFEFGDEIGVYVYNSETALYSNIKYTYDGADWNSEQEITVDADASVTCYAYYPYSESFNIENQDIAINNSADLYDNDFLFDEVNAEAGANLISFVLEHKMSLFEFKLDKTGSPATEVVLNNVKNILTLKSRNSFATNNESTGDVTMTCVNEANRIYRAFLPAQTIVNGTQYLTATIDGSSKTLTAKENMVLIEGCRILVNRIDNDSSFDSGLLVCGDFEDENDFNSNWTVDAKTKRTTPESVEQYGDIIINGSASLKLSAKGNNWAKGSQKINVVPGKTYVFGGVGILTHNVKPLDILICSDGTNLKTIISKVQFNSTTQQEFLGEVTIPEKLSEVYFGFKANDCIGFVDDIYFKLKE